MQPALDQISIEILKGVGPSMAAKLGKLSIKTVQDLLFHLPLRYQDRTRITPIRSLHAGYHAVIEGDIQAADITFGRRRSLVCCVQDSTGTITLRFFYFSATQQRRLIAGKRVRCFGEVRFGHSGLEIIHPECVALESQSPPLANQLTPIYPSTEGIGQAVWRKLCAQAVQQLQTHSFMELLPKRLMSAVSTRLLLTKEALIYLHQPPPDAPLSLLNTGRHPYQQHLAFEELLAHTLSVLTLRQSIRTLKAPALKSVEPFYQPFLSQLPFTLTAAQQRVYADIRHDLGQSKPMLRLLQGDVGSGKTVVAALTALQAIASGYQVAIMAPTEILAEQHLVNFSVWFESLNIKLGWLTAKVKGKQRQQRLKAIANHQVHAVIGTHALFQKDVVFAQLGLIIIDEQHRFGVHQRLALKDKATQNLHPHQLIMTATPIPRTLAMSAYADLDTSIIDELPPGRTPVDTLVIDNTRRHQVVERVRHACLAGRQAYWVCTLIEQSDALEAQAAQATCEALRESLSDIHVGLIHGRLKTDEKTLIMQAFKGHRIDLLVATTVIEVGVDVPNASLMIIDNAERLGLAQLHQLRGRVGRGATKSHCILLYQSPLSKQGRQRLHIMRNHQDGFMIAQKDLELRGPGQLLGTRQTGLMQLRIADLQRDAHLLDNVRQAGDNIVRHYPERIAPLIQRWLGGGEAYGQV